MDQAHTNLQALISASRTVEPQDKAALLRALPRMTPAQLASVEQALREEQRQVADIDTKHDKAVTTASGAFAAAVHEFEAHDMPALFHQAEADERGNDDRYADRLFDDHA